MNLTWPKEYLAGFWTHDLGELSSDLGIVGEAWTVPGWKIKEDRHPDWEFKLQIKGTSHWQFAGKPLVLEPNTLYAVAPGIRHAPTRPTPESTHFLFCRINIDAALARNPTLCAGWMKKDFFRINNALGLRTTLQKLITEAISENTMRPVICRSLIEVFLAEITRLMLSEKSPGPVVRHKGISLAVEEIDMRYHEKLSTTELARIAGMSPGYFGKVFLEETGFSPRDYIMLKRIDNAKNALVTTDCSITELAMDLGFASGGHFAREFKKISGRSPYEFRASSPKSKKSSR